MATTTERMVSLIPYYLSNGENTIKYFSVFAELFDELVQVFVQIQQSRNIDESALYGLDILGDIIGELRNGLEDPNFLENLRTKIRRNKSNGDIEMLNDFSRSILGDDFIGFSEPETSGTLQLEYNFPRSQILVKDPLSLLNKIKALGVKLMSTLNLLLNMNNYYGLAVHQASHITIKPKLLSLDSSTVNNYYGMIIHNNKTVTIKPQEFNLNSNVINNYYGLIMSNNKQVSLGGEA